jgi:hypothetical protein
MEVLLLRNTNESHLSLRNRESAFVAGIQTLSWPSYNAIWVISIYSPSNYLCNFLWNDGQSLLPGVDV